MEQSAIQEPPVAQEPPQEEKKRFILPRLQLPIPVYITRKRDGRKEAVWGWYRWADDPDAAADKFEEAVVGKSRKVCHIFEFPPLHGENRPMIFTRPTTAEQYVKDRDTGKGWTQVFTPVIDSGGIEYDVCMELLRHHSLGGPGFKNDESVTMLQRNTWYKSARKESSKRLIPNKKLPSVDIEMIALAMVEAGIEATDEKMARFIELLNGYKCS